MGAMHYETGKPCKHGHLAKRWVLSGQCVVCSARKQQEYYEENGGGVMAKLTRMLKRYGLSHVDYYTMLEAQGRACKTCLTPFEQHGEANVDHNHRTGKVRGLLCVRCNRGIGLFRDDPLSLRRAATYLENADD